MGNELSCPKCGSNLLAFDPIADDARKMASSGNICRFKVDSNNLYKFSNNKWIYINSYIGDYAACKCGYFAKYNEFINNNTTRNILKNNELLTSEINQLNNKMIQTNSQINIYINENKFLKEKLNKYENEIKILKEENSRITKIINNTKDLNDIITKKMKKLII